MKKIIVIIVLLINLLDTFSQKKNYISIDPISPVFGTFQMHYERSIGSKISIEFGFGLKTSSGVFELPNINTEKVKTDNFNFKGIKIIPEFRWYLSRNDIGLSGFYTGFYYKYQNYTMPLRGTYIDVTNQNYDISFDAKLVSNVVGLEIGYKLMIKKRFFADFIIAGPGFSYNYIELIEKAPIPQQGFYNDFAEAIEQYPILNNVELNINFADNQKSRSTQFGLPAFRYGIKIGYSF